MKGFGIAFILQGILLIMRDLLRHNSLFGHPQAPDSVCSYQDLYQIAARMLEEFFCLSYWFIGIGAFFIIVSIFYEICFARKKCVNCHKFCRRNDAYCGTCGIRLP